MPDAPIVHDKGAISDGVWSGATGGGHLRMCQTHFRLTLHKGSPLYLLIRLRNENRVKFLDTGCLRGGLRHQYPAHRSNDRSK